MTLEIDSLEQLRRLLERGRLPENARLQDLDLTGPEGDLLAQGHRTGLVVLGGRLTPDLEHRLRRRGAVLFPEALDAPVDPYRAHLYEPDELYAGLDRPEGYAATPDAEAHAWSRDACAGRDVVATLLRSVHDHAMVDSLDEVLDGRPAVGVMGGHATERGTDEYAAAAHLGHTLAAAGRVVLTGGGPGAMEAANLGATATDPAALAGALARLREVPSFRPSVDAWARLAHEVRAGLGTEGAGQSAGDPGGQVRSIGIPTWFYGHEPPNLFAQRIAKMFSNAVREDVLLARCTAGLVVLPGAAGTVQEIFQAVTPLYYAPAGATLPPLVLVGREQWTRRVPVWPAVRALATGRGMAAAVHLVETTEEAASLLLG